MVPDSWVFVILNFFLPYALVGALIGTVFGVLLAYALREPLANWWKNTLLGSFGMVVGALAAVLVMNDYTDLPHANWLSFSLALVLPLLAAAYRHRRRTTA